MPTPPPLSTPTVKVVIVYRSALGNCGYAFSSVPINSGSPYPVAVLYSCPQCKISHSFQAKNSIIVSTPSKLKVFEDYCKLHSITETNITVK